MKKRIKVAATAGVIVTCIACGAANANAQDTGHWRSATHRTEVMTGELTIAPENVTIYQSKFPMTFVRKLTPAEVGAVFDADTNAGIGGKLYSMHVPPRVYYAGGDLICGNEFIRWMATYVAGRTLQIAFFSGDDVPVFTFDTIANSTALCGTYVYTR